jgi:hypothetical protein
MGRHRHPGRPGSASSKPHTIANPDTEANPAANTSANPITDSSTDSASYPVTVGLTNAVADPSPSADGHGPDGTPTGATSRSRRRRRWRPASYRSRASGISSGTRDRPHPAEPQDRGRFGRPG